MSGVPRPRHRDAHGYPMIPSGEAPCVWMQAGVLAYWLCDRDLCCESCPLDAALRHARCTVAQPAALAPEVERKPGDPNRRSHLESLLDLRLGAPRPGNLYNEHHAWVDRLGAHRVRVGLDAFAASIVGPLRGVIPQPVETDLLRGQPLAWLDHEGGTLTLVAPISGRVCGVNPHLMAQPWRVHEDPEGDGYIAELVPLDFERDAAHLAGAAEQATRLATDVEKWRRLVRRSARCWADPVGSVLADGGTLVRDLTELLGARRRCAIAAAFLGRPGRADPR